MSKSIFRRLLSLAAPVCVLAMLFAGIPGTTFFTSAEEVKNYAFNPGFEDGPATEADRWGLWPGWDQGSFIGSDARSGSRAIAVTLKADQNYALYEGGISGAVMDVGGAAKLSMWVKYTDITGDGFMMGVERKTDGSENANHFSQRYTGSSDGWTQLTLDIPATDKAITELIIKVEIASGSGSLQIDDVALNGSEPKPPVADPDKNYARNASFENGNATEAGDWGLWPGWDQGSFIGSDAKDGSRAVSVALKADQNYALYQGGHNGADFDLKSAAVVSFWVKYNLDAGSSFKVILERKTADGNDNYIGDAITGSAADWKEIKLEVPASTQSITEWIIKIEITSGGGTLLIDNACLKLVTDDGSEEPPVVPDDKKPGVINTGETGTNLLTNPGFENGDQDWGVVAGASITSDIALTHSGAKAVKAVLGSEAYGSWNNLVTNFDKNAALRLSFWVRLDGVTGDGVSFGVERNCVDANDEPVSANVFSAPLTGTSDWQKVVVDIPATTGCYAVICKVSVGTGSGTVYFDDAYIGLADQSQAAENYAVNPGFEQGGTAEADKWGLAPGWDKVANPIATAGAYGGSRAVKITLGDQTRVLFQSNKWGMPEFDMKGEMFLSMWVKYDGVTGDGAYLKVERKANDEGVANVSGTAVTGSSDGWVQLKMIVPATAESIDEVIIALVAEAGTGTILVDDVVFRPATKEDKDSIKQPDPADPGKPDDSDSPDTGAALPVGIAVAAVASSGMLAAFKKRKDVK